MNPKLFIPTLSALLIAGCAPVGTETVAEVETGSAVTVNEHSSHGGGSSTMAIADRLNASPRHQEWVEVKNGDKSIYTWVVYPERKEKAAVVVLIHENRGLNDWARAMADQIAEAGYIAVAPDLLSSFSQTEKRTSNFKDEDAARTAIGQLKQEKVQSDLQAVTNWARTISSSNGKIVAAGFCWGGGQAFQFATMNDDLAAAMVFYGTGPTATGSYANIDVPVYGFYGGADERVNATIPRSERLMKEVDKRYDYKIYEGAGHAFMRTGEDPGGEAANVTARNAAWTRMKEILSNL